MTSEPVRDPLADHLLTLQRDWARQETADGFTQILFGGDRPLAGSSSEPVGNGARAGR